MSYVTVEVEIDHGRIVPREPEKLSETGIGLLTILLSGKAGNDASPAWPSGYFEKTAGILANEPMERPPQLPFEQREDWQA